PRVGPKPGRPIDRTIARIRWPRVGPKPARPNHRTIPRTHGLPGPAWDRSQLGRRTGRFRGNTDTPVPRGTEASSVDAPDDSAESTVRRGRGASAVDAPDD